MKQIFSRSKQLLVGLILASTLSLTPSTSFGQYAREYFLTGNQENPYQQASPAVIRAGDGDYTVQTVSDNDIDRDILITRVNQIDGQVVWSHVFGSESHNEQGFALIEGNPGEIIIVGDRTPEGFPLESSFTQNYVLCIDDAGTFLWDRELGNDSVFESSRLIVRAEGITPELNFIVAGPAENKDDNIKLQTYAFSATGAMLWWTRYADLAPPKFDDYLPTSMIQLENNEVVIAGHGHNGLEKTAQIFTLGINPTNGDIVIPGGLTSGMLFYDILGEFTEERFPSIAQAPDLSGLGMSFNLRTPSTKELIGFVRLANTRQPITTSLYNLDIDFDIERPINIINDGPVYALSLFLQTPATPVGRAGIMRLNISGAFIDAHLFNIPAQNLHYMTRDPAGKYIAKLTFHDPVNVFTLFHTSPPGLGLNGCEAEITLAEQYDIPNEIIEHPYLADMNYPIAFAAPDVDDVFTPLATNLLCPPPTVEKTSEETSNGVAANEGEMAIYPNPSNGHVTLNFATELTEVTITVIDVLGRHVHQQTVNSNTVQLDLSAQKAGIYTVLLHAGDTFQSQKLMIE